MNAKIPFVVIRQIQLRVNVNWSASGVKTQNHQRVTMSPSFRHQGCVTS